MLNVTYLAWNFNEQVRNYFSLASAMSLFIESM